MDEYDEYQQVMTTLRRSYNQEKAEQRELVEQEEWKGTLRQQFLSLLQQEMELTQEGDALSC